MEAKEERKPIYQPGDRVRIIKYGHVLWESKQQRKEMVKSGYSSKEKPDNILYEDEQTYWFDHNPEMVGKIAIVDKVSMVQGVPHYSLRGLKPTEKSSWYYETQLEKHL